MFTVIRFKMLSVAAVLLVGAVLNSNAAYAVDTVTEAITLHNSGVSDEVLIAWAGQQPPVARTTENLTKLKEAKLSGDVVDALLAGNTRAKAAAVAPKPAAPADDADIRLAGNAQPAEDPPSTIVCGIQPTVVIDGNTVYNYEPFHTFVYGWPHVYAIYPWYPEHGYTYGRDWDRHDWGWNREHEYFRWQNQTSPAVINNTANGTAVSNHPPHWPQRSNIEAVNAQGETQNRPHARPRDFDWQQQTNVVHTPTANVETHVTSTGVKYVTQAPQSQPSAPVQSAPASTPHYYVPPANTAPQSQNTPGGFRR